MKIVNNYIFTTAQADSFLSKLDTLSNAMFTKTHTLNEHIDLLFTPKERSYLSIELQQDNLADSSPENLQADLNRIELYIQSLPVCNIETAVDLSVSQIEHLRDWFRTNVTFPVLTRLTVDQKLVAGITIDFRGLHKDFSLKSAIHNKFPNNTSVTI